MRLYEIGKKFVNVDKNVLFESAKRAERYSYRHTYRNRAEAIRNFLRAYNRSRCEVNSGHQIKSIKSMAAMAKSNHQPNGLAAC